MTLSERYCSKLGMKSVFDEIPILNVKAHERRAIHAERRRQRISKANERGTHTGEQWMSLLLEFDFECAKCGSQDRIQKDHVTPIIMGGSNLISNLQPLCIECNAGKGTDTTNWVEIRRSERGFYEN